MDVPSSALTKTCSLDERGRGSMGASELRTRLGVAPVSMSCAQSEPGSVNDERVK